MLVRMAEGMEVHIQVCMAVERMVLDMVEGMLVCMAVERMEVCILDCKVLHKQACMEEDRRACKVHKLARKDRNSCRCIGCYSLSTEVPKHPKKSTRLVFPVVFSLKTPYV